MNTQRHLRTFAATGLIGALVWIAGGCDIPSFVDPGEMAGLRDNAKEPLLVQVLDDIDPVHEQNNRDFAAAEGPRPEDFVSEPADYVIGPNDLVQVTVFDLEGPGLQTIKTTRVSGTGNVTLPYLKGSVRAKGLTEAELQDAISEQYRREEIVDPARVSVSVVEARSRAYSVLGSVARPGDYYITQEEFRVLHALSQAGDVASSLIEELYIFRRTDDVAARPGEGAPVGQPGSGPTTRPAGADPAGGGTTQPLDDLAPPPGPQSRAGRTPRAMKKTVLLQEQGASDDLAPGAAPADTAVVIQEEDDPAARVGRIDGQDVLVRPADEDAAAAAPPEGLGESAEPFEFDPLERPRNIRVIKIPLSKLRTGDLQYNIPIRPGDTIMVPPGVVGYYYMGGHVQGVGTYQLSGQKVTLMQAITAARGMDGLAIPQRTDIVRRIGPNESVFVRVDVARIFAGKSPDIFLKPNDHVLVGTNFLAPFLASIRGGFRLTYGFGFLYDKNFAYDNDDQRR